MLVAARGHAANLLKPSNKRKRTRQKMYEVKDEEKVLKEDKQKFLQETKRLKLDKEALEKRLLEMKPLEDMIHNLEEEDAIA